MAGDQKWTREEVILALELYLREGRQQVDARHAEIGALSRLLNRLEDYTFPNAVAKRLGIRRGCR